MLLMQLLNSNRKKLSAKKISLSIIAIARCIGPILLKIKTYKQVTIKHRETLFALLKYLIMLDLQ